MLSPLALEAWPYAVLRRLGCVVYVCLAAPAAPSPGSVESQPPLKKSGRTGCATPPSASSCLPGLVAPLPAPRWARLLPLLSVLAGAAAGRAVLLACSLASGLSVLCT